MYARVSTPGQAERGYSLNGQMETLRDHAVAQGYEVVDEVTDAGWSGAYLERPGLDHVRELVRAGAVDVVLARTRDRISREPGLTYLLKMEFAEYGCQLRALNDLGDGTPEGELGDGMLDQIGRFQRQVLAREGNKGKLRKAREGKIIATRTPDYGFAFSEDGESYVVVEEEMGVVRRVFELVAGGAALHRVKRILEAEGIPAPKGGKYWAMKTLREIVLDDAYKPFDHGEVAALVEEGLMRPDVAARLDPQERYGMWYFNKRRFFRKQVKEVGPDGRIEYKKRQRIEVKPRVEWIAVPVLDAGVPREPVDGARAAIADNKRPSKAGNRVWELSGGVLRCACCGRALNATRQRRTPHDGYLNYYRCSARNSHGVDTCPRTRGLRAERIEAEVWEFVSALVTMPDRLAAALDQEVEQVRRMAALGDPERQERALLERLGGLDAQRSRFQDQQAAGLMTLDELRERLARLEEDREGLEKELAASRNSSLRITELEMLKETLFMEYTILGPLVMAEWPPEKRVDLYRQIRLRVEVDEDDGLSMDFMHQADDPVCETGPSPTCWRFRAST